MLDPGYSCRVNLTECYIVVDEYGKPLNKAKGIELYSTEYYAIDQAKSEIRTFSDIKLKACVLKCSVVAEVQIEDPVKVKKIEIKLPVPPPRPTGEMIVEGETKAS